jgi:hypothetical protein
MRRTQLYLDEAQYRWLKSQAGRRGSIAEVVRGLIDAARTRQADASRDPLIQHLLGEPSERGNEQTTVQTLDDDLYGS